MIDQSFLPEVFEGDNKYHCSNCDAYVEKAVKKQVIERIPPFVIVTINRFYYDRVTATRKKLLNPVNVGIEIDINKELFAE